MIMESFEIAKTKLIEVLEKQNRPTNIIWISREDISQIGTLTFCNIANSNKNEELARSVYERGVSLGFGVGLISQFYTGHLSISYAWHPKHQKDAQEHLQGPGLKISIIGKPPKPTRFKEIGIKNKLLWKMLKWLEDEDSPYQFALIDIPKSDGSIIYWNEGK